jgi:hypothetical protein
MPAALHKPLLAACLLVLPSTGFAQLPPQTRPYDPGQVELDQELNHFNATATFKSIHRISAQVRGVQAADKVVYWVSPDRTVLSAYQGEQQLWHLNVRHAFEPTLAQAQIRSLVLSQHVLFVSVQQGGFAEVDRRTGNLTHKTIDLQP